jgi:hypothetical protein
MFISPSQKIASSVFFTLCAYFERVFTNSHGNSVLRAKSHALSRSYNI